MNATASELTPRQKAALGNFWTLQGHKSDLETLGDIEGCRTGMAKAARQAGALAKTISEAAASAVPDYHPDVFALADTLREIATVMHGIRCLLDGRREWRAAYLEAIENSAGPVGEWE